MLLILLQEFFPPIVLSTLHMEKCQLSYKTLKKLKKNSYLAIGCLIPLLKRN